MADVIAAILGARSDPAATVVTRFFQANEAYLHGMIEGTSDELSGEDANYVLGDEETKADDEILLDSCRHCSDHFQYTWKNWTTKVVVGIPKDETYHAVSYVWGQTKLLSLRCSACSKVIEAPFESAEKFRRLMRIINKSGDCIWLDALSIDQSNDDEKNKILSVMGTIYRNASSVMVLLPKSDERAYRILSALGRAATYINTSALANQSPGDIQRDDKLTLMCRSFDALIDDFERGLNQWAYWQRAWTFQEWALASNITITLDKNYFAGNFVGIKHPIIKAAATMAAYKLLTHQYSVIDFGYSRGQVPRRFDTLKRLFPDESAFYPIDMLEETEVRDGIAMSTFNFGRVLRIKSLDDGTRQMIMQDAPLKMLVDLRPGRASDPSVQYTERLYNAWHALGVSKRKARFEADLVASWASMCDIKYEYNAKDSFAEALRKVLTVLREKKFQIYSFHVNTTDVQVDATFLDYASPHRQCNATNSDYFYGLPIRTGRADTLIHFKHAVMLAKEKVALDTPQTSSFRKVLGVKIAGTTNLKDIDNVIAEFSRAMSGENLDSTTIVDLQFSDVRRNLLGFLKDTDAHILEKKQLVNVVISAKSFHNQGSEVPFNLWAIVPADSDASTTSYAVVREPVNGTLLLGMSSDAAAFEPLAYVVLTDNLCGTFLISVDEGGKFELTLNTPVRGDVMNTYIPWEREISLSVQLAGEDLSSSFGRLKVSKS